jgi:hypothetical protein
MAAVRRAFLDARELPRLCWGALSGSDVALRRILGARRAGRVGVLGAALALCAAVPPRDLWVMGAAHALLSLGSRPWLGVLGAKQQQRLVLWLAAPLLAAAALARALGAPPLAPALLALVAAHALLARHLRAWRPAPD